MSALFYACLVARYKLIICNQNYSSWSLRGWLALEHFGLDYEVEKTLISIPGPQEALSKISPSGKVPVLLDQKISEQPIWDSLAIIEHLAQEHPEIDMWPKDPAARAFARSAAAEVHSSFAELRNTMPMNCKRKGIKVEIGAECASNLERIATIWKEGQSAYGSMGPYLAGKLSLVDIMYAPVVWRLATYVHDAPKHVHDYCETMRKLPAMQLWESQALAEAGGIAAYDALGTPSA